MYVIQMTQSGKTVPAWNGENKTDAFAKFSELTGKAIKNVNRNRKTIILLEGNNKIAWGDYQKLPLRIQKRK